MLLAGPAGGLCALAAEQQAQNRERGAEECGEQAMIVEVLSWSAIDDEGRDGAH